LAPRLFNRFFCTSALIAETSELPPDVQSSTLQSYGPIAAMIGFGIAVVLVMLWVMPKKPPGKKQLPSRCYGAKALVCVFPAGRCDSHRCIDVCNRLQFLAKLLGDFR
jgi:hypothetical protein